MFDWGRSCEFRLLLAGDVWMRQVLWIQVFLAGDVWVRQVPGIQIIFSRRCLNEVGPLNSGIFNRRCLNEAGPVNSGIFTIRCEFRLFLAGDFWVRQVLWIQVFLTGGVWARQVLWIQVIFSRRCLNEAGPVNSDIFAERCLLAHKYTLFSYPVWGLPFVVQLRAKFSPSAAIVLAFQFCLL